MSNVPIIHVHTASDKSTTGYAIFMWEAMRSLANHPDALKLSIHGIGPTAGDRLGGMPNTKAYQVATNDNNNSGSAAHGACVEHALSMMDDGDIHILSDSDTVMLAKGWDDYVRIKLLDEKIGMIGTAVEDVGGFSSGAGVVQMAKNLPTIAWSALTPLKSWRNLKAMPSKDSNIVVNTDELSKIYNLPVGYQVYRDVGWQIPQYLHDNGITYQAWKQLKPSGDAVILKGLSDYHEEYHTDEHTPFVAHQRGSLRHAYRTDGISKSFYETIDRYVAAEKARATTRWTWEPNDKNAEALGTMTNLKTTWLNLNTSAKIEEIAIPASSTSSTGTNIEGWLKASLDGTVIRSRNVLPVQKTLSVDFVPDASTRHLRLEGVVADLALEVAIPSTASKPHMLTVRNLTNGRITVKTTDTKQVVVPMGACWLLLADVDGVTHVE